MLFILIPYDAYSLSTFPCFHPILQELSVW